MKIRSAGWQDLLVALSGENELVALGAGNGKMLWRQAIEGEVASLLCTTSTVFVGTREGVLHALRRTDGTERWRLAVLLDPSTGEILLRMPVGVADLASFGHGEKNTLFVAFADGRLEAFDPWYELVKLTPP